MKDDEQELIEMRREALPVDVAKALDGRRVNVSFSSEHPVDRGEFIEVLDHSPGAIDGTRLNARAPFLKNHDPDKQLGSVVSWELDHVGRRGRAVVEFESSEFAERELAATREGHRSNYSFGYFFKKSDCVVERRGAGEKPVLRVKKFQPYEITCATIPADHTVGVARSLEMVNPSKKSEKPAIMSESAPVAEPVKVVSEAERSAIIAEHEQKRQRRENVLNNAHNVLQRTIGEQGARNFLAPFQPGGSRQDTPVEQILAEMQDLPDPTATRAAIPENRFEPDIDVPEKDAAGFSLFRALEDAADNKGRATGLLAEISQERAKLCGREPEGFFLPSAGDLIRSLPAHRRDAFLERRHHERSAELFAGQRAPMGTEALAGLQDESELVPLDHREDEFIEFLRPRTVFDRLGSRQISGITGGDLDLPRQNGGAVAAFVLENADLSESNATFDQLTLKPKEVGLYSTYTKKLLRQSAPSVENTVRQDLNNAISELVEDKGFNGSGTGAEPQGILGATGVLTNLVGTTGSPDWTETVNFESLVEQAHALRGRLAYACALTPTKNFWKTTPQIAGAHPFIWESGDMVNGYMAVGTSHLAGTAGQSVLFGNYDDHIMGIWSGIDVVIDTVTGAASRTINFYANFMMDMDVRIGASFCKDTGV